MYKGFKDLIFHNENCCNQRTKEVICLFFGKGSPHDFKLFQTSAVHLHPETKSLQDKGYQCIQKLHANSRLPVKKPKGGSLTQDQKASNRKLARERICIEHINRRFKVFKILAETAIAVVAMGYVVI